MFHPRFRRGERGEAFEALPGDGRREGGGRSRQVLSSKVVEGNVERYEFTWPGKRAAKAAASAATTKTLRPCREESVDFDTTENLYIEGDNLEVLKLLQTTYAGKVKMIYIDPPYNTGHDFVYRDRGDCEKSLQNTPCAGDADHDVICVLAVNAYYEGKRQFFAHWRDRRRNVVHHRVRRGLHR